MMEITIFGIILLIVVIGLIGWTLYSFGRMRVVSTSILSHPKKRSVFDYYGQRHLNETVMRVYGHEFRKYAIYNGDNIIIHKWGYVANDVLSDLEGYPVLVIDCFPEKMFCLGKYVGFCNDYHEQIPDWSGIFDKYCHRIKIDRDKFITQMRMDYSILSEENNFFSTGDMAIVEMYDGGNTFYKLIPEWRIYGDVERVQDRDYENSKE